MPVQRCSSGGKSGWRWGGSGKCYVGPGARARAIAQGMAARASGYAEKSDLKIYRRYFKAESVDEELGLVFGWGIICQENGVDYYDVQGDHIPQQSMLEAAADFMLKSRRHREMHRKDDGGCAVFLFPLTDEVADAYGITCSKRGMMVAMKPSPEVLAKFKSGEYTGFSIGGARIEDEAV